jgi:hypothetical protein
MLSEYSGVFIEASGPFLELLDDEGKEGALSEEDNVDSCFIDDETDCCFEYRIKLF